MYGTVAQMVTQACIATYVSLTIYFAHHWLWLTSHCWFTHMNNQMVRDRGHTISKECWWRYTTNKTEICWYEVDIQSTSKVNLIAFITELLGKLFWLVRITRDTTHASTPTVQMYVPLYVYVSIEEDGLQYPKLWLNDILSIVSKYCYLLKQTKVVNKALLPCNCLKVLVIALTKWLWHP